MNVNQAIEALTKLADEGHGFLELIACDGRDGSSSSASIASTVSEKQEHDDIGTLCEWEDGRKYVSVYTDH